MSGRCLCGRAKWPGSRECETCALQAKRAGRGSDGRPLYVVTESPHRCVWCSARIPAARKRRRARTCSYGCWRAMNNAARTAAYHAKVGR